MPLNYVTKERRRSESHVRFTKGDYRPYVRPIDLVNSENFQRELKLATERKERMSQKTQDRTDQV